MGDFVDYYEVLQVSCTADAEVIEKAYKALIFKHHPDRGGSEAEAKAIIGAHYVLSDRQRRDEYDQKYREWKTREAATAGDRPVPIVDQVPPEIIDAILAATWLEGAAATARTAARVAGTVAVTGAVSVIGAAASVPAALRQAKEQQRREEERQRIAADRQRAVEAEGHRLADCRARADRASLTWSPTVSYDAVAMFAKLLAGSRSWIGDDLTENELLWLALRHPYPEVRHKTIERLAAKHPGEMIVAHLSRGRRVVLNPTSVASAHPIWQPDARSAEFVDDTGLRRATSRRAQILFWTQVMAAIAAMVVAIIGVWALNETFVAVPQYVGLSISSLGVLEPENVGLGALEVVYPSEEGRRGQVTSQTPHAGAIVRRGSTLTLEVVGPKLITVPSVVGMPALEAREALAACGLRIVTITCDGTVSEQSPDAGALAYPSTEVWLD